MYLFTDCYYYLDHVKADMCVPIGPALYTAFTLQ